MHASSLDNMQWCRDRFVSPAMLRQDRPLRVLDVGGADCNGSYGPLFRPPFFNYLSADIDGEAAVDLPMSSPDRIPAEDGAFDLVISGQMLEHAEFFWQVFAEMARVVADDGLLFLIAPSAGPIHRFPVDCYRFYPDAYRALAKFAGMHALHIFHDDRGPWNDLVGVFAHQPAEANKTVPEALLELQPEPASHGDDTTEAMAGDCNYHKLLSAVHEAMQPKRYLEIGVRAGSSLRLARCAAVGVDPAPAEGLEPAREHRIVRTTSTDFFRTVADDDPIFPVDLAFIDGLHRFENVLADFIGIERRATPDSVVIIDDVFPNHRDQAARERHTRCWTGDVWKILPCLSQYRPDLLLIPFDTWPTGCLLVAGLQPQNQSLIRAFNPIVRKLGMQGPSVPPQSILERHGAYPTPDAATLRELLGRLRAQLPANRQAARAEIDRTLRTDR